MYSGDAHIEPVNVALKAASGAILSAICFVRVGWMKKPSRVSCLLRVSTD